MGDFLKEIGYLGVTARIKRLNDSLTYNIKALYAAQNLDIEPSWHLVFLLLKEEGKLSPKMLSNKLLISQPAITKVIKKMVAKGYVQQNISNEDSRVKMIELTDKSKKLFPKWERVWDAGQESIAEILANNKSFLNALATLEKEIEKKSFKERAEAKMSTNSKF